jgi:SNF2-related domain/Helicase conserved C-terminal domain
MARAVVDPTTFEETFETLCGRARRRFGKLPQELVAAHVIASTPGADWPVRSAALDALHRRRRFGERDQLVVASRPPDGAVLGLYATARKGQGQGNGNGGNGNGKGKGKSNGRAGSRPYTTLLASLVPLRGSCDCADFLRSSLGVCKHLLCVVDDVCSKPARVEAAEREQARVSAVPVGAVWWDPALPLSGPLDRARGLRLALGPRAKKIPEGWVVEKRGRSGAVSRVASHARHASHASHASHATHEDGEGLRAWRLLSATAAALAPPAGATLCELDPARLTNVEARLALLRSVASSRLPAEPAARALLADEIARAERWLDARRAGERARPLLKTLKRTLYAYQREGVDRFLDSGRLLLADDMGLGKTTQAIACCHALYHSKSVGRGLLVVPAALKLQWLREWEDTTDVPAAIVDGRPDERAAQYRSLGRGFLILGYEQLLRDFAEVQALAPDLVVLDEAQRIKNWATKSAVYVKALAPRWRLVLTGTPMENRLEELASLLDWVDDVALAPKWRLDPWHTYASGAGAGGRSGAKNLDTLRARLAPCVVRRRRQEVLKQLPARTDTRVPVSMTPQQQLEHDELIVPIRQLMAVAARRPLLQAEFLKLMQMLTKQRIISNGLGQLRFDEIWPAYAGARPDEALLEGLFAPKLGELRRLVADLALDQERKIVVFSQWRRMLRLAHWSLSDVLGDAGVSAVFFTGAESTAQRTRSIVDFHDEPHVRVMFLSDAGGVGLNLQRAASACVNLELPWNPAVLEQRIGRIYRLGQKRPIDVFNLVSDYGIEARIATLVSNKRALFSGLFDGATDTVAFSGKSSFFADVEKLVAEAPEAPAGRAPAALPEAEPDADAIHDEPDADAIEDEPGDTAPDRQTPDLVLPAAHVGGLLSSVRVRRTDGGGVAIEAPPEAAASLMALFQGMAQLMAQAAAPLDEG